MSVSSADLINALTRCEFVLRRITEGDHQALQNAEEVAADAREVLIQAGYEPEE